MKETMVSAVLTNANCAAQGIVMNALEDIAQDMANGGIDLLSMYKEMTAKNSFNPSAEFMRLHR